jgi:outer membrane protein insertion porin family
MSRNEHIYHGLILIITLLATFIIQSAINPVFAIDDLGPKRRLFKIDRIKVEGTKKVEVEAILEKISSRKGLVLDNYLLRKDIQKIYRMKYFEFVEAHKKVIKKKNVLIFKVKEKPIISRIVLNGNDELDEEDIMAEVKTKEFTILDINTIKSDLISVQKLYEEKGFFLAAINYNLKYLKNGTVELTFDINEFDKVKVKKIIFLGNKAFKDGQLKDIMETREESLFSFLSDAGNFKDFNFQTDIERIKYFYKTKGYLQVNVGTPEITVSEDKKWVFITVKVNEGPQFSINDLSFQGEVLFPESELREKITLKEEETYSEERLRKDIQLLTEMYQDKGYAFANVLRTLRVVPGENKVDVEFSFEKGKIAYFGKITVVGNNKTRDKVVRRELKIREGAKFSGTDLRRSKENVNRLGFFEKGSIVFNTISPKGKDDVLDVEITVKERNTGQISLGAGYSTTSGGFLNASIAQNNFRGLGQNLTFSFTHSSDSTTYNLGFTEPYFMDSKWSAGGDIFSQKSTASNSFSYKRQGFDIRVGYPIYDYTRLFLTYKFEDTQLENVVDPSVVPEVENGIASSIKSTIINDNRNNKFEPSSGHYISFGVEYAGIGGDKKWFKTELDARYFYSVVGDLVFRSRLFGSKLDVVNKKPIPRTEKFTLGGARNLRGYDFEDIGPKETIPVDGRNRTFNRGGLMAVYGQLELEHPLAREAGLKWVLFYDIGNVYDSYLGRGNDFSVRQDYGFGFRWFSPIGVLRFEFGYPVRPQAGEAGSQFHFDIGQLF